MNNKLLKIMGLTGLISLLSYTAAVVFSPLDFPGYDWMSQAVSDLSADSAPSLELWNRLSAFYGVCNTLCVTCAAVYVHDSKVPGRLLRIGIYLFAVMNWISSIGYRMFPLSDSGKEIETFQEKMHIVVTAAVVGLSIASLVIIIIAGFGKKAHQKGLAIWAAAALTMMFVGAIGQGIVPKDYFGIVERFSVFAAVGFNAVLGIYLFRGFGSKEHQEAAE